MITSLNIFLLQISFHNDDVSNKWEKIYFTVQIQEIRLDTHITKKMKWSVEQQTAKSDL